MCLCVCVCACARVRMHRASSCLQQQQRMSKLQVSITIINHLSEVLLQGSVEASFSGWGVHITGL